MTDIIKVDPFDNVVATGKATTKYRPEGPSSLFGFLLKLGGTTFAKTHMSSIKIKAASKELVPGITGSRLVDLVEYEGMIDDSAYVPILFGDPTARTARGQHIGNFDHTVYPGDITIEVDISGATAPTLEALALVAPPKGAMGLGYTQGEIELHRAMIETVLTPSAAVTRKAFNIGLGSEAGALLKKLAFFHANITQVSVKKSGIDIYEDIANADASYIQDDLFARVPQSGLVVWDAIVDGNYSEAKTTIKADGTPFSYNVRLSTSASDTITAYADVLTKLPLI